MERRKGVVGAVADGGKKARGEKLIEREEDKMKWREEEKYNEREGERDWWRAEGETKKDENKDEEACKRVIFARRKQNTSKWDNLRSQNTRARKGAGLNEQSESSDARGGVERESGRRSWETGEWEESKFRALVSKHLPLTCQLLLYNDFSHSTRSLITRLFSQAARMGQVMLTWILSTPVAPLDPSHKAIH